MLLRFYHFDACLDKRLIVKDTKGIKECEMNDRKSPIKFLIWNNNKRNKNLINSILFSAAKWEEGPKLFESKSDYGHCVVQVKILKLAFVDCS